MCVSKSKRIGMENQERLHMREKERGNLQPGCFEANKDPREKMKERKLDLSIGG